MTGISRRVAAVVAALAMALFGLTLMTAVPAAAIVDDAHPASVWRPANGIAFTQARIGDMIVLGGSFTSMRSPTGATATRNHLAAISATTGELLPWAPNPNGTDVRTVSASPDGTTVYVGGTFTSIGGASRSNAAAVSVTTGRATSFVANTNGEVRTMKIIDGGLFVAGAFGKINNLSRGNGAEVDPTTGAVRAWDPKTNWGIITVTPAADNSGLFIGGYFTRAGGAARDYAAKVDRTSGALQGWTSGSSCQDSTNPCVVWDIASTPDTVYLAAGGPGGRVVSLDPVTGRQRWWTGADGDFTSLVIEGTKVYASGHFEQAVAGATRAGIVVLDATTGAVLPDLATPLVGGSGVWKILRDGDQLRACGQFSTVGGVALGKYTSFTVLPDPPDTQPPATPAGFRVPTALYDNVSMSWSVAADDVATVAYRVYRDGTQIGSSAATNFKDRTASPGTTYTYTVVAVDGAGNTSSPARAVTVTTEASTPRLLNRGASWSYLSMGVVPASGWTTGGFAETDWAKGGVGEFGFGDGDEDTYISPKGVAHYFRTSFPVTDPGTVDLATLRILADDGAVVYLNGAEIARLNMPAGTITNDSTALTSLSGTQEMTYTSVPLPVGQLKSGTNQLAVEVHNQSAASSDVSFDAFVTYVPKVGPVAPGAVTGLVGTPDTQQARLDWVPTPNADYYVVQRDGQQVGQVTGTSFTDTGLTAHTDYTYSVRAVNAVGPGPWSAGLVVSTTSPPPPAPQSPTALRVASVTSSQVVLAWDPLDGADRYVVVRDGVDLPSVAATTLTDTGLAPGTTYTYRVFARNAGGDSAPSDPVTATTDSAPISTYVAAGSTWRYLDLAATAPSGWTAPGFDTSSWKVGKAQLGYGDGDEASVLSFGSNANAKPITNYFQTTFDAGASVSDVTGLALRTIVDDGAVVYVNGNEVWRFNLPTGTVTSTTRAVTAIAGTEESRWRTATIPASVLNPGRNTVAIEVHQDAPSSSDTSMDLELKPVR